MVLYSVETCQGSANLPSYMVTIQAVVAKVTVPAGMVTGLVALKYRDFGTTWPSMDHVTRDPRDPNWWHPLVDADALYFHTTFHTRGPGPSVSEHRPLRLVWMCNRYCACCRIVGTTGTAPSVSAHCPSRCVWMWNGYKAWRPIVRTTGTGPPVSAHLSSRLLWICHGYPACCCMVGTTSTAPSVIAHRPSRLVWKYIGYTRCRRMVVTTGTGPCVSPGQTGMTRVNGQWIYIMWPYCLHSRYWPLCDIER